jgi:hypothetical protein
MPDRDDGGERREREALTKKERGQLSQLASFMGFADFMAVMMVLATGFSALATWRTATIADAIYRASERPYFGVEKVYFESSQPSDARVVVQFQNFGPVPADDVVVGEQLSLDGRPLTNGSYSRDAGVISPGVPHEIRVRVTEGDHQAVIAGRAQLAVEVKARYRDSSLRTHCYLERFVYYPDSDHFDASGGSARCDEQEG